MLHGDQRDSGPYPVLSCGWFERLVDQRQGRETLDSMGGVSTSYVHGRRRHGSWKWFSPTIALMLMCTVPCLWMIEWDVYKQRRGCGKINLNDDRNPSPCDDSYFNKTSLPPIFGHEVPFVAMILPDWALALHQMLLFSLILGRWLLPKGELSRDQLSQLLLVQVGMAADILEFVGEGLKVDEIYDNDVHVLILLSVWTWSLPQFTLSLTLTKGRKTRVAGVRPLAAEHRKKPLIRVQRDGESDHCHFFCGTETWAILVTLMMQDLPFLASRLYLIISPRVPLSIPFLFFTSKNALLTVLQLYRLAVILHEYREKRKARDRRVGAKLSRSESTDLRDATVGRTDEPILIDDLDKTPSLWVTSRFFYGSGEDRQHLRHRKHVSVQTEWPCNVVDDNSVFLNHRRISDHQDDVNNEPSPEKCINQNTSSTVGSDSSFGQSGNKNVFVFLVDFSDGEEKDRNDDVHSGGSEQGIEHGNGDFSDASPGSDDEQDAGDEGGRDRAAGVDDEEGVHNGGSNDPVTEMERESESTDPNHANISKECAAVDISSLPNMPSLDQRQRSPGSETRCPTENSGGFGGEKATIERSHEVSESNMSKQDEGGFKLPGLPLPTKTGHAGPKKFHSPASATLENRTNNVKPDESKDKTDHAFQPYSEEFNFPKPKQSNIPKHKKDPQMSGPIPGAEQSSPQEQPLLPASTVKKSREKSPAEKLAKAPPLPYIEPSWSGVPNEPYHLEVLKSGAIIAKIPLNDKAYHVFGRLEICDIPLEHPSLSRYHLVLQYRLMGDSEHDPGFYLYDLGSTHGSWFNKQKMEGRVFYRMRVGHMFKLGGSSRMYILQGPAEDQDAESELSVTELKELRQKQLAELEDRRRATQEQAANERREEKERDEGISWGMDYEDAQEEDTRGDNPFAIMTQEEKEATYIKDPKKALRGYFEREGYDLEYNVEEKESGFNKQFVCKVELPLDDASGRPIFAEAAVVGKKKEAVVACALEACRILDAHGVLRQATHESHKRKVKNWKEDDYYDSDEDTFLDRTGEIEKKRLQRMKKAGIIKEKAQTYDSLKSHLSDVETEMQKIEEEMSTQSKSSASAVLQDDSLDAFMESIQGGKTLDKTWRAKLKLRLIELKKEQARLSRLVDIAKPATMPALQKSSTQTSFAAFSKKLPMFGSMKGHAGLRPKLKTVMQSPTAVPVSSPSQRAIEEKQEVEEEEDEPIEVASPPAATSSSEHTRVELLDKPLTASRPSSVSAPTHSTSTEHKPDPAVSKSHSPLPHARKLGPSLPTKIQIQNEWEAKDSTGRSATSLAREERSPTKKPRRARDDSGSAKRTRMSEETLRQREMAEMEDKEDFTDWTPPIGQTGDGRTHLNAKFGY
ncbi:kanadaptin-like [Acanthaster planci]|uniref:Kanadaptin-like n=1 Tax=Acanthaster planci TaxID=133434 RepID=A0A8B7YF16_ACAPL|nr:kanadaptin-like [Acanthaster planci]